MNNSTQPKKTIYRGTEDSNIRTIWDYCDKTNDYKQRIRGNRYQAYIQIPNQKLSTSKCFKTIVDARNWLSKARYEIENVAQFEKMSFKILFQRFIEHQRKIVGLSTIEANKANSLHLTYFHNLQADKIDSLVIDQWLLHVTSERYRILNTVKSTRFSYIKEVKLLHQIFNFYKEYIRNGKSFNPILKRHKKDSIFKREVYDKRKAERNQKFMTSEQMDSLLSCFKHQSELNSEKFLYYVCCLIQLNTGMRIGEVIALKYEDIEWTTGQYNIHKTALWKRSDESTDRLGEVPKNRRNRPIYFNRNILEALKKLRSLQSRIGGFIFSRDGLSFISRGSILHHYNYAMKAVGIPFTGTHITRHSFATDFLNSGITNALPALQGILGHSTPKQTLDYAKLVGQSNINALNEYDQKRMKI